MKKMMWVWVLIVLLVIAGLVYITINKNGSLGSETEQVGQEEETNMKNITEGVQVVILKESTGEESKVGDTVDMNYTGTLENGTVFDSNVDPKFQHVEPFTFTIGAGQVIKGWDVGVAGMKVGEKRKLVLAPDFAYGATGAGGIIPPNATLTFEVELVAIKK
jgi:FKBP-type peptidyl-prolyl cis-trans isomerase